MSNKLLLADDSITIQKVVGIIFANEDYELTVVDNGDAALEKAKQIVPDIILVDALMPGKNGYEVCSGVRKDPKLRTIPLLLMTGAFEPFDEEKARQSGADDFISKPFESQQLIDRVNKLIELGKERVSSPAAAALAAPVPPVSPEPVPQATPPVLDDLSQAFATEAVTEGKVEEVFSLGDEAVEGSADDDLWGAFEIDEVSSGSTSSATPAAEPTAAPVEADAFSFADVNDEVADASVTGTQAAAVQEFETGWEPVDEQTFAFQEEDETDGTQPVDLGVTVQPSEFEFAPETAEPALEDSFAFDDGIETVEEVDSPFPEPPVQQPAAQLAAQEVETAAPSVAGMSQPAEITEAQLVAALRNLSREVIEKVVWEVVPDLAEILIKEEIRKLKDGSGS